jgi:hypothetical protein
MRWICPLVVILVLLQFSGPMVRAESSMDVLENELNEAQQQHEDASSKQYTDLISTLDQAFQSPDAALQLYQSAGGRMPAPAPVIIFHPPNETPDEKALRVAQDQAVDAAFASIIQLHCGVMRYAVTFVQNPGQKGLHDDWVAWLKQAAQMYPQAGIIPPDTRPRPLASQGQGQGQRRRNRERQQAGGNANTDNNADTNPDTNADTNTDTNADTNPDANSDANPDANDQGGQPVPGRRSARQDFADALKEKAVRDSVISGYFSYHAWGDKDQGTWRVRDIPHFYRTEILDPLRVKPSTETLSAWDAYIAMESADEPDRDKWNTLDYPTLQFQRSCDDFYIGPTDDKIEALVELVKNNPTNPDLGNWIAQVKQMIQDYRTFKSTGTLPPPVGATTNAPPAAPSASAPTPAPVPTATSAPAPVPASTGA